MYMPSVVIPSVRGPPQPHPSVAFESRIRMPRRMYRALAPTPVRALSKGLKLVVRPSVHAGFPPENSTGDRAFVHGVQLTRLSDPWIQSDQYTEFSGGRLIHWSN